MNVYATGAGNVPAPFDAKFSYAQTYNNSTLFSEVKKGKESSTKFGIDGRDGKVSGS